MNAFLAMNNRQRIALGASALGALVVAFLLFRMMSQPSYTTIASPASNPYVNQAAGLRAVPLPRDTLAVPSVPMRTPYSVPYGPNFSRPSGSVVIPFGSSRYYYHR